MIFPEALLRSPFKEGILATDGKGTFTYNYKSNKKHGGLTLMEITDISDAAKPKFIQSYTAGSIGNKPNYFMFLPANSTMYRHKQDVANINQCYIFMDKQNTINVTYSN